MATYNADAGATALTAAKLLVSTQQSRVTCENIMAWEFRYKLSLDLDHPSMNPEDITSKIPEVKPCHTATAGVPIPGRPRVPVWSVWIARLHEEEWQHSETQDFADALRKSLERLTPYGDLFKEIRQSGHAYFQIVYFSDTKHCVSVIPPDLLRRCGELNLDLDLEFYGPDANTNP